MAATSSSQVANRDPTFRNYDAESAKKYLQYRSGYSDRLIELVISQHASSGGGFDLLLDVGCGPGIATRSVAPYFQHAIGADPGQSMIEAARTVESSTKSGEPITYEVCSAEALSGLSALKGPNSVDLITAATAAHWFDMPHFWGEAAKVLKPGGSVIIWGSGGYLCDPNTTPNALKLQQFLKDFEVETLGPYEQPGNKLSRELYVDLGMPWECLDRIDESDSDLRKRLQEFDEKEFVRLEFNKDGQVPPGESFFSANLRVTFQQIKVMLGTASPVTRWREAHKAALESGEIEDVIDVMIRRAQEIMDEGDGEKGRDWIEAGSSAVVLVVKKKK